MSPIVQSLPSVDQVLLRPATQALLAAHSREYVVSLIRDAIQALRDEILSDGGVEDAGEGDDHVRGHLLQRVEEQLGHALQRAQRVYRCRRVEWHRQAR